MKVLLKGCGVFPELGSMCVQRAVNVGLSEQALDGEQDGPDIIQGRPLVLQDVQADVTLGVHVGVVAGCEEPHRGRIVRVATGELQRELIPQVFVYLASEKQRWRENLTSQPEPHTRGAF